MLANEVVLVVVKALTAGTVKAVARAVAGGARAVARVAAAKVDQEIVQIASIEAEEETKEV